MSGGRGGGGGARGATFRVAALECRRFDRTYRIGHVGAEQILSDTAASILRPGIMTSAAGISILTPPRSSNFLPARFRNVLVVLAGRLSVRDTFEGPLAVSGIERFPF